MAVNIIKTNTLLKWILALTLVIFGALGVLWNGGNRVLASSEDVGVSANVDYDYEVVVEESYFTVSKNTAELGEPILVRLFLLEKSGTPVVDHNWLIVMDPSTVACTISYVDDTTQSDGTARAYLTCREYGTYNVSVYFQTNVGEYLKVQGTEAITFVDVEVPVLQEEPEYTLGDSNTLYWNSTISCSAFYLEASTSNDFSSDVFSSGWINFSEYSFEALELGTMYYYRMKCMNFYSIEGAWSNDVSSTQFQDEINIHLDNVEFEENQEESTFRVFTTADWELFNNLELWVRKEDGDWEYWGEISQESEEFQASDYLGSYPYDWNGSYSFKIVFRTLDGRTGETNVVHVEVMILSEEPEPEEPGNWFDPIIDVVNSIDSMTKEFVNELTEGEENLFVIATSLIVAIPLITFFEYLNLPYIIGSFADFLWFIGFVKRPNKVGIVYNSITKDGVSGAVVRLINQNGKLVETTVSDTKGSFYFRTEDVKVKVLCSMFGYEFPSKIIVSSEDFPYKNVYNLKQAAEYIKLKDDISIPIDPVERPWWKMQLTSLTSYLWTLIRKLDLILLGVGLVSSVIVVYIGRGSSWSWVPLITNVILILLKAYIAYRDGRVNKFSILIDQEGKRIKGVTLDLIDTEFNQTVARRITDSKGRFRFFIKKGSYKLQISDKYYTLIAPNYENGILIKNNSDKEITISDRFIVKSF